MSLRAPGNILIILLALLEPAFILWLVYWRKHRKDASLDAVIKLFAVGASSHTHKVHIYIYYIHIIVDDGGRVGASHRLYDCARKYKSSLVMSL